MGVNPARHRQYRKQPVYQPILHVLGLEPDHPLTFVSVKYCSDKARKYHEPTVRGTLRECKCLTDCHGFGHRTVAMYVDLEAAERDADRIVRLNMPNVAIQISDNEEVWNNPPPPMTKEQLQRALDRGRANGIYDYLNRPT